MSAHMNSSFLVKRTLSKTSLAVVGVVAPPGKLIRFPTTVSRVRCVSYFYGLILSTIIP